MIQGEIGAKHFAICIIQEDHHSGVHGVVKFIQEEGRKVQIFAELNGLKPGLHGFHVHEFGMCYYFFISFVL